MSTKFALLHYAEFRVPLELAATKLEGLRKRQQNKPFYMAIMLEQA